MTTKFERRNAIVYTRQFLFDLMNQLATPRVPLKIRHRARALLKHYPAACDVNEVMQEIETVLVKGEMNENVREMQEIKKEPSEKETNQKGRRKSKKD